jgi:hypothetical protein
VLLDEPRPGRPRKIGDDEIAETIRLTLETTLPGVTHWSLRSTAKAVGYAPSTIASGAPSECNRIGRKPSSC